MAKRYAHSNTTTADLAGSCLGRRVTQTFASGSAPDELANDRSTALEHDELVKSIDQHGFVPAISRCDIAEAFNNNNRAQQAAHRRGANEIVKTFRLSGSLLLGSVADQTVERVTAADRRISSRVPDRKRSRQHVDGQRSQRRAWWNPIVMQNLGCLIRPLSGSTLLWRTKPSDGRLPLGREE